MTGPERKVQNIVERNLSDLGWLVFRTVLAGRRGFPDTTAMKDGRTIYIEFKSKTGHLSPQQIQWKELLEAQGCEVIVSRTWEDVEACL